MPGARDWYDGGVDAYYARHGGAYANPHAAAVAAAVRGAVARWRPDLSHVLDLAAGAGEVTLALRGLAERVGGIDPYTHAAYTRATGQPCERLTFADVATGALAGRRYSLIACSFALHLAGRSMLPPICLALAALAPSLLILTPHKRPMIPPAWGWQIVGEHTTARVRARFYRSVIAD